VQAHQPHLVAGLAAVGVAEQRQLRRQLARAAAARGFEPVGEFVEVFLAAQEAGVVLARGADCGQLPALLDELAREFRRRKRLARGAQLADDARELVEARRRRAASAA
jgi:hypothetical protein